MTEVVKTLSRNCLTQKSIFVVHVSEGYEDRFEHIEKMLGEMNLKHEYMLRGDIKDITEAVKKKYFKVSDDFNSPSAMSCALKHVLICEEIVERNLPGALVLEDDIILHKNFLPIFKLSMKQLSEWNVSTSQGGVIINYEDTRLRFVERSRRKRGVVIYKGDRDRMTGCFYINNAAARILLDRMKQEGGMDRPIDLYQRHLLDLGLIEYLWCEPTIATQGSHVGLFKSAITNKTRIDEIKWLIKRLYKKLLYQMR